ncbi:MAG: RadC family protein [Bacteroidota bacterium]
MQPKIPIKQWASQDRPREKLLARGINSLTDAELIAILLGSGTREISAVELARQVLEHVGNNLSALGRITIPELMKMKGIGEAKAISIMAAMELGRRRKRDDVLQQEKITSSQQISALFQAQLADLPHEEFWLVLLNRSNTILGQIKISQGGTAGTVIDIKIILKHAIDQRASSIILVHNHPSGNVAPSHADKTITAKLKTAADYMDISVLDHIIVTEKSYFSFADEGLL